MAASKIKKNGGFPPRLNLRAILSGRPLKNGAIKDSPKTKYKTKKAGGSVKRKSGGKIMQGYKAGGKV